MCSSRQKEILNEAVKMLKTGGSLLYSTCTYAPEEDEKICAYLVNKLGFKLVKTKVNVSTRLGRKSCWNRICKEILATR